MNGTNHLRLNVLDKQFGTARKRNISYSQRHALPTWDDFFVRKARYSLKTSDQLCPNTAIVKAFYSSSFLNAPFLQFMEGDSITDKKAQR